MPSMLSDLHKKTNGFTGFVAEAIPTCQIQSRKWITTAWFILDQWFFLVNINFYDIKQMKIMNRDHGHHIITN